MTMLCSWIGIDTHGHASAYILSDSRFSWGNHGYFDYGKKVFASKKYPEIFGYVGDVLFPSIILSQIVEMIDSDLLLNPKMACEEKHKVIAEKICQSLSNYPEVLEHRKIQIIHISRDTTFDGYPQFHAYMFDLLKNSKKVTEIDIPKESGIIEVLGTGSKEVISMFNKYKKAAGTSTSRYVYQSFVDALINTNDPYCGGAPQLVGLYRKPCTNGYNFGIIYKGKRYLLGMEIPKDSEFAKIEWRNELFERCDGDVLKPTPDAMRQPKPIF